MCGKQLEQCSRGDSCSFSHGSNRGQPAQSSSPAPKAQTQIDGRKPSKGIGSRGEKVLLEGKVRKRARNISKEIARIRRVIISIVPNVEITNLYRDANSASKKSKKSGGGGSVALLKESVQLGCVSQDTETPKKSILQKGEKLGSNRAAKFTKGTWQDTKKSGKKGSIARDFATSVNLMGAQCAPNFEERTLQEPLGTRTMCPQRSMGPGEEGLQAHKKGYRCMGDARILFEKSQRSEFVVDSAAC